MSYLFSNDGTLAGKFPDGDSRVFVLEGLRQCPAADVVAAAIRNMTPFSIANCRVLLVMEEKVLRDLAATVFSESSHNANESEGIMRVIYNRAKRKGATFGGVAFWNQVGGNSIDGRKTGNYSSANAVPIESWTGNMQSDLAATVRTLVGTADLFGGAYFWIATWIKTGNNLFGNGLKANPPTFVVTKEWGGTTFLKYNPASPKFGNHVWP